MLNRVYTVLKDRPDTVCYGEIQIDGKGGIELVDIQRLFEEEKQELTRISDTEFSAPFDMDFDEIMLYSDDHITFKLRASGAECYINCSEGIRFPCRELETWLEAIGTDPDNLFAMFIKTKWQKENRKNDKG